MKRRTLIRRLSHALMLLGVAFWVALVGMMLDAGIEDQDLGVLALSGGVMTLAGVALWVIANMRDARRDV